MYQSFVSDWCTGYNYRSRQYSQLLQEGKVKTAPSKGAVKRENFKQYIIARVELRHNRRAVPINVNFVPFLNIF